MFIKANTKSVNGKRYTHYLLVESVKTAGGPRHKVVCSLGNLKPAPKEHWLQLARKVEAALAGQLPILPDVQVEEIVAKIGTASEEAVECGSKGGVEIVVDRVATERLREAGPVHVGHQMWQRLGMSEVLRQAGLDERACALTEILVLNRLAQPASERGTRSWIFRTALPDILGWEMPAVGHNTLYRHLDKLYPQRHLIESLLAERERTLFNLDSSVLLYDLTSTYFEGQCSRNEQAKHGYSRGGRPDCKQVVMGLVLNRDGFSIAHEVFEGNRTDTTTLPEMLDLLDKRAAGNAVGRTVMMDRGISSQSNLRLLAERGYHYVVAANQKERDGLLAQLDDKAGWSEVDGKEAKVRIKRVPPEVVTAIKSIALERKAAKAAAAAEGAKNEKDHERARLLQQKAEEAAQAEKDARFAFEHPELWVLCVSPGRTEKDRAIREKQEGRLLVDLEKLGKRVASGSLKSQAKIHEAIGRLRERYPRVARYYDIRIDEKSGSLCWEENMLRKLAAESLDGSYLLKTDRLDISDDEIWRTYMLLTKVEAAFRDLKSPLLMERPIFHQLQHRVQTHVFICVLAYHLLVAIEKCFRDHGLETSWETLREELRTHQVCTVVMPTTDGRVLRLRHTTTPEKVHQKIYEILGIPSEVIRPLKTWSSS